jgi:hypothetical protein
MERTLIRSRAQYVCLALAVWIGACATPQIVPAYLEAEPALVREALVAVLTRDGYVLEPSDPELTFLSGRQERTVSRFEFGLLPGTELTTEVVVEAEPSGSGTNVLATYSIRSRLKTGESRIWVSESPLAEHTRQGMLADLRAELGLAPPRRRR